MRTLNDLRPKQHEAINWLGDGERGALLATMGSGKTVICLTHLLNHRPFPALVISSKRVVEMVWDQECEEWAHLRNQFTFKSLTGDKKEREAMLNERADIYLINIENIQWLMEHLKTSDTPNLFDCVILDELSLWGGMGKRWKAVRQWLANDVTEVIGLTGTPASNGYERLWPQMELIEPGMLGRTMTLYRQRHFWQEREHLIKLREGEGDKILARMGEHVFRISNDELDMPGLQENDIRVDIDLAGRQMIAEFRREDYIREFDDDDNPGWEISGNTAASSVNKLVQMGNGYVYADDMRVIRVHYGKRDALQEYIVQQQGNPVLIAYYYKHDLHAIQSAIPGIQCMNGDITKAEAIRLEHNWNTGNLPYMAIHPGSAGHGLNLQKGNCDRILWYSMVWDLDLYEQTNARIVRPGNKSETVFVDRLIAGREDRTIAEALSNKRDVQTALLNYYEEYHQ